MRQAPQLLVAHCPSTHYCDAVVTWTVERLLGCQIPHQQHASPQRPSPDCNWAQSSGFLTLTCHP